MFRRLFGHKRTNHVIADALYMEIVAAARQPEFYAGFGVPDTPLGRFELIALHMVLFLRRLKGRGVILEEIGQHVTDEYFKDIDYALRELGIGDTSVPKRMKKLARMFYGRAASYTAAIDDGDRIALAAALARNIMPETAGEWSGANPLAVLVLKACEHLDTVPDEDICKGRISFSGTILASRERIN